MLNCECWCSLMHVLRLWTILELSAISNNKSKTLCFCDGSLQHWWKFNTCSMSAMRTCFMSHLLVLVLVSVSRELVLVSALILKELVLVLVLVLLQLVLTTTLPVSCFVVVRKCTIAVSVITNAVSWYSHCLFMSLQLRRERGVISSPRDQKNCGGCWWVNAFTFLNWIQSFVTWPLL